MNKREIRKYCKTFKHKLPYVPKEKKRFSSNEVVASFKLTGTFTYPYNSSAKCTSATYSTKINDSKWPFSNCSASTSGNSAIGCFTAKNKIAGITISTIEKSIILSCDKNGNIS